MYRVRTLLAAIIFFFSAFSASAKATSDSVSDVKKVTNFTIIKIKGNFNVVLTQAKECSLKVVAADKDAMAGIDIKNAGTQLVINAKEGSKGAGTIYIGVKELLQLTVTTNGTVTSTNQINTDVLALNIDGDAVVKLDLDVKELTYTDNSNKSIVLTGKIKKCTLKDNGEASIDASGMKTDDMTIEDTSDGDLKVNVRSNMQVKIGGSGNLTYFGKPTNKVVKVQGSASESQIIEGK